MFWFRLSLEILWLIRRSLLNQLFQAEVKDNMLFFPWSSRAAASAVPTPSMPWPSSAFPRMMRPVDLRGGSCVRARCCGEHPVQLFEEQVCWKIPSGAMAGIFCPLVQQPPDLTIPGTGLECGEYCLPQPFQNLLVQVQVPSALGEVVEDSELQPPI